MSVQYSSAERDKEWRQGQGNHYGGTQLAPKPFTCDGGEHRAVTFLPSNQRFEGWLPAGTYAIIGDCVLEGIDVVKLLRINADQQVGRSVWYINRVSFECRIDWPLLRN